MRKILFLFPFLFWPIELYLNNTVKDFLSYFVPMLMLLGSILTKERKNDFASMILMCLTPLVSVKLAIVPVFYYIFSTVGVKNKTLPLSGLACSLLLFVFLYKSYVGQTIFKISNDETQRLISDSHLYSNVFLARANHNKALLVVDKYIGNFTELIDVNNYFFSFHPMQPVKSNQQLVKFPFFSLPLFLFALFKFPYKKKVNVLFVLFASFVGLSTLVNYDRNDFILLAPLCLVYFNGIKELKTNNIYVRIYIFFFLLFGAVDFFRLFL